MVRGLLKSFKSCVLNQSYFQKSCFKVKHIFKQFNSNLILRKISCTCSSIHVVADGFNACDKCVIVQGNVDQFAHIPISKALHTSIK